MLVDDALYIQNKFYSTQKKLKDLKGTFALTLIKQAPLVAALTVAVGYVAH
jgi:hypothetical protein